jgi:hypothetical protein
MFELDKMDTPQNIRVDAKTCDFLLIQLRHLTVFSNQRDVNTVETENLAETRQKLATRYNNINYLLKISHVQTY